ncbi:MAG: cupin domain-containing protein [Nitrospiraceae bacterium]|nr:cupin domain-containing protein [Nitrospiraceae bacterium]
MFIRNLDGCPEFTAGDNCRLRELLHPDKTALELRYSLAHAVVAPGQTTWPHALRTSEVYYILRGEGQMHIDGETAPVRPGDAVYIPPQAKQQITNTGTADLVFLCIVDPAWRKEDEVVIPCNGKKEK